MSKMTKLALTLAVGIGLSCSTLNAQKASQDRAMLGFKPFHESIDEQHSGIRIFAVVAGSPAERAGILKGDLITRINGERFLFDNDLQMGRRLQKVEIGERLVFEVLRDKQHLAFEVVAAEASDDVLTYRDQWTKVAADRLARGEEIYCDAKSMVEREPWTVFLRSISDRALLQVTRLTATGEYSFKVDDGGRLPKGFALEHMPDGHQAVLKQIRVGDTLELSVALRDGGWVVKPTKFPDYLASGSSN